MMFMKQDIDDQGMKKGDERGGKNGQIQPSTILPGLEKLCRNFDENHQRI